MTEQIDQMNQETRQSRNDDPLESPPEQGLLYRPARKQQGPDQNLPDESQRHQIQPAQNPPSKDPYITISVSDSTSNRTYFQLDKSIEMSRLFDASCKRHGKEPNDTRFLFDGMRVEEHDTPETVGMQDRDDLEMRIEQTGG